MHAPNWAMTDEQWQELAEVEAVLDIVKFYTTAVQYERRPMAALGHPLRSRLLKQLRADAIPVVDLNNVTASSNVPRVHKPVATWSNLGKKCLRRAILEAERRFCGNDALEEGTEDNNNLNHGQPHLMDLQACAMMLDPRTVILTRTLTLNVVPVSLCTV